MKTLILALIISGTSFAQQGGTREITDSQAIRRLVSVARDVENERILEGVSELQDCKRQNPVTPGANGSVDPNDVARLRTCIANKFRGRPAQEIERISERLKLEAFELIPSKSTENITKYLTTKVYKSMTGVDLKDQEERDKTNFIRSQKFGTKKMLDQKDFFVLYKNQMSKNVIYEISRFCFNDLRDPTKPTPADQNFVSHWNLANFDEQNARATDTGIPKFELNSQNPAIDADAAYPEIIRTITGGSTTPIDENKLFEFFQFCARQMGKLCDDYEKECRGTSDTKSCEGKPGGKACLSKTRIIAFRKALASSDLSLQKFMEDNGNNPRLALDPNQTLKRYQGGRGQNEQSFNQLTNNASVDFFKANEGEDFSKAQECISSNGADCDEFSIVNDSVARISANTEILYTAKREAEMARVRELVNGNNQTLNEYLDKNYPDLKVKLAAGEITNATLEQAIAQRWDGQRAAMIKEIQDRIQPRQITEQAAENEDTKKDAAVANARTALNERARLAQVVFFNNIISSSLRLEDESGNSAGRNTQTLTNELDSVENAVQDDSLFQNIRRIADSGDANENTSSSGQGNTISDIGFLYELIGVQRQGEGAQRRGTASRRTGAAD